MTDGGSAASSADFMKETVASGTATALNGYGFTAAGKTGSAEYGANGTEGTHSWFVGFSNVDDPDLSALQLLQRTEVPGSQTAVPIAGVGISGILQYQAELGHSLKEFETCPLFSCARQKKSYTVSSDFYKFTTRTGGIAMIEATSCGGVVIFRATDTCSVQELQEQVRRLGSSEG